MISNNNHLNLPSFIHRIYCSLNFILIPWQYYLSFRNVHITDIGLGYLATMSKLTLLHIRWCPQITDIGLESIISQVKTLKYLSLAGIHQITARSLLYLVEAELLEEVELTNCPSVNRDLLLFLSTRLPKCNIIF